MPSSDGRSNGLLTHGVLAKDASETRRPIPCAARVPAQLVFRRLSAFKAFVLGQGKMKALPFRKTPEHLAQQLIEACRILEHRIVTRAFNNYDVKLRRVLAINLEVCGIQVRVDRSNRRL